MNTSSLEGNIDTGIACDYMLRGVKRHVKGLSLDAFSFLSTCPSALFLRLNFSHLFVAIGHGEVIFLSPVGNCCC